MTKLASLRKKVPYTARVLMYYVFLFSAFRYLVHGYLEDNLSRQLLGVENTLLVTLVVVFYLALCAVPPYLWSRYSLYRSLSRGVEAFICYAVVVLSLGGLFFLLDPEGWKVWYGLTAGSGAGERIFSTAAVFLVFMAAAWWGGRGAKRRRTSGKRRRAGGST